MKKFGDVLKAKYKGNFYAHKARNKRNYEKETLENHSKNTLDYYEKIVSELDLDKRIKDMLEKVVEPEDVNTFLGLFRELIYYHDIGKASPPFQKEKMENKIKSNFKFNALSSNHSLYGKFLFDFIFVTDYIKFWNDKSEEERNKYCQLVLLFSSIISKHHTALNEMNSIKKELQEGTFSETETLSDLFRIKDDFFNASGYFFKDTSNLYEYYDFSLLINSFNEEQKEILFYLYKLIYSLMIISDYYATMEFLQGKNFVPDLKKIDGDLKEKISKEFYKDKKIDRKRYDFNKKLKNDKYVNRLSAKYVKDINDFGNLKTKILLEADDNLRYYLEKKPDKKVFYLNVPTGGGKTNTSMKLALSILEKNKELKKIFYVFPFINIIEQNYKVIQNTLNLNENEISPIYSTSSWGKESDEKEEELKYVLGNEFLNFPFVVMSNVNFFNSFIKSGKKSNYKLHNLANSVVILDEIQSLNDEDWTIFSDFIKFASENLNIYFIIMSATLPRLDKISLKLSEKESNKNQDYAVDLINNPEELHMHKLFKDRVNIEYDPKIDSFDNIIKEVDKNMKRNSRLLVVFNTIKDSSDFYTQLTKKGEERNGVNFYKNFEIILLNSTFLPSRRREIIDKLERAKKEDKKIILISTQSIEAGMDVDCDYGLREMAIFDSIEQVAGRVNREGDDNRKNKGYLKVFKLKNRSLEKSVYRGSFRAKTIKKKYKEDNKIKNFLKNRDFSLSKEGYYSNVVSLIEESNESKIKEAPIDKVKFIRNLDYKSLNEENVIDQNSVSIFVGLEIPKNEFTDLEIDLLKKFGINASGKTINGKEVWDSYKRLSNPKVRKDFTEKKIESKKFASILNKFIFSIPVFKADKIKDYFEEDPIKGIYYLNPETRIYSYVEGLKDSDLLSNII